MATKKPYQRISKKTDNDVQSSKQVPVPPRDRLARQTKDSIKFVKQVPVHPRETLKRKIKLDNYSHLNKKVKMMMLLSSSKYPFTLEKEWKG